MQVVLISSLGMAASVLLFAYGHYRQKNYLRLPPPLISPNLWMFVALIGFLVFGAQLFGSLTGITWTPPQSRL